MMAYVKDTLTGFYSLLAGLGVTIRYFVKPIVTVQYPREKIAMSPRYRGHTEFVIDAETGTHLCNACENCARTCPSGVITVTGAKPPGSKKKRAVTYALEYNLCSLCGLCVEVCPTKALKFSDEYRLAGYSRQDSRIDVLARLQARQRALGLPEEVPPAPEATESKPEAPQAEGGES
jgi:NADH-quinone oxidoreductase chain I